MPRTRQKGVPKANDQHIAAVNNLKLENATENQEKKEARKRYKNQGSREGSQHAAITEKNEIGNKSSKLAKRHHEKKPVTETEAINIDSKPNGKVRKKYTKLKVTGQKDRSLQRNDTNKQMLSGEGIPRHHMRKQHENDSKTDAVDEIDGDKETSEYFSSDTCMKQSLDDRNRKRKVLAGKNSMSSKVKQLKVSTPDLSTKKNVYSESIKSEETDTSDSDFEEVPDVKSPVHVANKKVPQKSEIDNVENNLNKAEHKISMRKFSQQKKKEKIAENKSTHNSKEDDITNTRLAKVNSTFSEKSGNNESSESDFEEVPDVTYPSLSHKKCVNKKETGVLDTGFDMLKETEAPVLKKNGHKRANTVTCTKSEDKIKRNNNRKRKSDLPESSGNTNENMPAKRTKNVKKSGSKTQKEETQSKNMNASKTDSKVKAVRNSKKKGNSKKEPENTAVVKPVKGKPAKKQMQSLKAVDHSDVTALLMHMEGPGALVKPSTSYAEDDNEMISDDDSGEDENGSGDDSEGEWEDVEDHHGNSPVKSQLPDNPVEITLDAPVIYKKRKKREFDIKAYFQKQINKYKRELNISMHKVHLLCLLSRGFYLNNLCMDETLEAQAMSISMTTRELKIASVKSCDVNGLTYMIKWMKEAFPLKTTGDDQVVDLRGKLENSFHQRCVTSRLEFVLVCIILLRQLGYLTRLVMSLQPIPIRAVPKKEASSGKKRSGNLAKIQKKVKETDGLDQKKSNVGAKSTHSEKDKTTQRHPNKSTSKTSKAKRTLKTGSVNQTEDTSSKNDNKTNSATKTAGREMSKDNKSKVNNKASKESNKKDENIDSEEENNNSRLKTKTKSRRSCASKIRPNAYADNDAEVDDSGEDFVPGKDETADDDDDDSGSEGLEEKQDKKTLKLKKVKKEEIESSEDEFAEERFQLRTQALKKISPTQKNKKALSSDSGEAAGASSGADEWVEVFLQKEQRWVCVDCVTGKLDKPYSVEHNATPPVHYIVGFRGDGTVKDVTARYASQWLTTTRKFRADEDWWSETMTLYEHCDRKMDEIEDREIQSHLLQRPLPTSIASFKSHPLYALKRHLLKFEAIYPDTAVPLGYIRGEPVYARECVHVLHSRENWLKEGRAVRIGEEPYKHVKSRPKWNKPKENPDALDLEVFGRWQTEVYIPPPAVDGKVPRNAHGNVELFLPSMLPAGTVHLQIEGLNKVAKKLDIDCAPAMVGWDHHCGFSHPRMDGWIVCEEFKDILLAAWDEEQEIIREKEQEKREKRVYSNWKLLIKGLLIKERLKKRFDLEEEKQSTSSAKAPTQEIEPEKKEKAVDYKKSWPQNRQKQDQKHFDVEKL